MNIQNYFENTDAVQNVLSDANKGKQQLVTGLLDSAKLLLLQTLVQSKQEPVVVVVDNLAKAEKMYDDLHAVLPEEQLFLFPVEEIIAAEVATSSPTYRGNRVTALNGLLQHQAGVYVTSVSGVRRHLPQPDVFGMATFSISMGNDYDFTELQHKLFVMGYEHAEMVEKPGEFAVRGSIIDIYPLNQENPVRLDFFDTEIDSIRAFDSDNQRSIENIDEVTILPATDLVIDDDGLTEAMNKMSAMLTTRSKKLGQADQDQLSNNIAPVIERWKHHDLVPEDIMFEKQLFNEPSSILDYAGDDSILMADDYTRLIDAERDISTNEMSWITDQLEKGQLLDNEGFGFELRDLFKDKRQTQLFLSMFQKGMGRLRFDQITEVTTRAVQEFFGQMPALKGEIDRWHKQGHTVVILTNSSKRQEKISETLNDFEIFSTIAEPNDIKSGSVSLIQGSLENGFEFPAAKLVVLTERELFAKVKRRKPRRQTIENAERLKSYTELKPGDYVVHVNHGIGKFTGMTTMEVDGVHQDYITIQYKGTGQLFIPVTQLNLVQKYVAAEGKRPTLNKLGGSDWAKTKRKVASKIEDIADDLVQLYAKRESEKGFAFPPDDDYQRQFENDFAYSETPDQLRSIEEIKRDMERPRPMDRLLVGDVGYGKTEVALRAAFKAVEAGKQVAILVPTTILAQQHFDTMHDRFEGYPIEIGMLSRFQTSKQIKDTVAGMKAGSVDVVVGTHRLLSKDVDFKDLGLLVIDEEQRFGVKHKERIKELRSQVDVLTLTATPIPRTLNMSMMGVRDLSVIETPPTNRYPIQTYVMEENVGSLRDGIQREMRRGGQVFYLHNRVDDIERVVSEVEALVPEATVGYIHGQMTEKQLEDVLVEFIEGQYDVLVTTTIIETGIDIPNVNTLFVENADHMGLSQLYQIRGRIGRSSRVAYAYFTYQKNKVLTEVGEKRLEAIKDFTELGSGFKIAMRDLSIRGAGNLLGKQQHGFIDSVGYDMYTQMLSDAVSKKRGKKVRPKSDAEIELGIEAFIPDQYVNDQQQKIEFYKRIRQVENNDQLMEVQDDLIDRFGEYPLEVANLVQVAKLKLEADRALIEKIERKDDLIFITLSAKASTDISGEGIFEALSVTKLRATIAENNGKMHVKLVIQPKMQQATWFGQLIDFIKALNKELVEN